MTENCTKIIIILAHHYKSEQLDLEERAESAQVNPGYSIAVWFWGLLHY